MGIHICNKRGLMLYNLSVNELKVLTAALKYLSGDVAFQKFAKAETGLFAADDLHHYLSSALQSAQTMPDHSAPVRSLFTAFRNVTGYPPTTGGTRYGDSVSRVSEADLKAFEERVDKWLAELRGTDANQRPDGTMVTPPSAKTAGAQPKEASFQASPTQAPQAASLNINSLNAALEQAQAVVNSMPVWHDTDPAPDDDVDF